MNLEDKARDYSYRQTCMDSIIEKLTMDELDHVTKLQISSYVAGHQSRDEEVKRLESKIDGLTTRLVSYEATIGFLKDTLCEIANEDFRGNRPSGSVKAFHALQKLKN